MSERRERGARRGKDPGAHPMVRADGLRVWYRGGQVHRTGGPAIEWPDGEKHWYADGDHHREDGGPDMEGATIRLWHKHGLVIREEPIP